MNRKQILLIVLAVVLLGGAGWLIEGQINAPGPLAIGEGAIGFTVPTLASGPLRLADYRHQVVVVNFWATWCPPCVEETPSLEKFARQMRGQGVAVIGISVDDNQGALDKFVAKYHLTYPIGRDPGGRLAARYGTVKYPETYILDADGNIADKIIGGIDWEDPRIISFVGDLAHPGK